MIRRIKQVYETEYKTIGGHYLYDITVYYSTGDTETLINIDSKTAYDGIPADVLNFMFIYSHVHHVQLDDVTKPCGVTKETIYYRRPRY